MGSSLLAVVYHPLVCLTVALAIVLFVRQPLCRAFGPRVAYTIWGLVPLVALGALIPVPARLPKQVAILHVPQPVAILHAPQPAAILDVPHAGAVIGHGHDDPSRWVIACWMIGAGLLAWAQWYQQRTFVRRLGMIRQDETGEWVSEAPEIGPVVVGVFPPKIVLPFDFRHRYTLQEQALVLAHERMHLRRHDPLANFGAAIVRSLLWFHPLVHLANRAFRIDQELACDAAVLEACPHDRHRYATALLKTQIDGQELAAGAAGCCLAAQTTSSFKRRILMLRTPAPPAWRRLLGTTVIVASYLVSSGFAWTSHVLPLPVTKGLFRMHSQSRLQGMADSQMKGDSDTNYYQFQGMYKRVGNIDYKMEVILFRPMLDTTYHFVVVDRDRGKIVYNSDKDGKKCWNSKGKKLADFLNNTDRTYYSEPDHTRLTEGWDSRNVNSSMVIHWKNKDQAMPLIDCQWLGREGEKDGWRRINSLDIVPWDSAIDRPFSRDKSVRRNWFPQDTLHLAGVSASSQAQATDSSKVETFVGNPNEPLYKMIDTALKAKKVVIVNGIRKFAIRSDTSSYYYTIENRTEWFGTAAIDTYGADAAANGVALFNVIYPGYKDTAYVINAVSGDWRLITLHRNGEIDLVKGTPGRDLAAFDVTHFRPIIVDGVRVYYTKSDISKISRIDWTNKQWRFAYGQGCVAKYGPDAAYGVLVLRSKIKDNGIERPWVDCETRK